MGIAADLFHSSDPDRETFDRRITPTDDQQTAQQERWNDLADFLKARLKNDTKCSTKAACPGLSGTIFGANMEPSWVQVGAKSGPSWGQVDFQRRFG